MGEQRAVIRDDKRQVRGHLDLSNAQWRLAAEEGADPAGDFYEVAFIEHTDGVTYTVMRKAREPEGKVLVFTPAEWDKFNEAAENGEFDDFLMRMRG
jgi:hypothetical protein